MINGWKTNKPLDYFMPDVIPAVFGKELSYYEKLSRVVEICNNVLENNELLEKAYETFTQNTNNSYVNFTNKINSDYKDFTDASTADYNSFVQNVQNKVSELETYMNNYFENLDIQEEVNNKIDGLVSDGTISAIISSLIPSMVEKWLQDNVGSGSNPPVDKTLTLLNAAADAQVTGDMRKSLSMIWLYLASLPIMSGKIQTGNIHFIATSTSHNWVTNKNVTLEVPCNPGDTLMFFTGSYNFVGLQPINGTWLNGTTELSNFIIPSNNLTDSYYISSKRIAPENSTSFKIRFIPISNATTAGQSTVIGEDYFFEGCYLANVTQMSLSQDYLNATVVPYRLVPRGGVQYPNISTETRNLTIYNNTAVVNSIGMEVFLLPTTTLNLNTNTSLAMIYIDLTEKTALVKTNTFRPNKNQCLIGVISSDNRGWLTCPFTVDLNFMGMVNNPTPNYWANTTIWNRSANSGFSIALQTDTHLSSQYFSVGFESLKNLCSKMNVECAAHLGDITRGFGSDTHETQIRDLRISCQGLCNNVNTNMFYAKGNHENMHNITNQEIMNNIMAKVHYKLGIQSKTLYYYKDIGEYRIIVLDTSDTSSQGIGNEQLQWLENVANTQQNVIILCHEPLIQSINPNWVNSYGSAFNIIKSIPNIVCIFSGHTHKQDSAVLDGVLNITCLNGIYAEVFIIDNANRTIESQTYGFSGNRNFTY